MTKKKIPFGANLLALFMGLEGVAGLISLIAVYLSGLPVSEILESSGLGEIIKPGYIYIAGVLAATYFVGALYVIKGHQYGWWALIIWTLMESTKKIYDLYLGGLFFYVGIAGLLIIAVILRYLLKSEVMGAFGISFNSRFTKSKQRQTRRK